MLGDRINVFRQPVGTAQVYSKQRYHGQISFICNFWPCIHVYPRHTWRFGNDV